jgi:hypothetical protein
LKGTEARAVSSGIQGVLSLETKNREQLDGIIEQLSKVKSVTNIERI